MKGFVVKFEGEIYKVAVPEGVLTIAADMVNGNASFQVNGLKINDDIFFRWINSVLELGDKIEIEFAVFNEISESMVEEPYETVIKKHMKAVPDKNTDWEYKIKRYNLLKELLLDEGII